MVYSPQQVAQPQTIYYHMSTTNKSFLEVHKYLEDSGIQNNKFFLALLDPDLARIDPHDPMLSTQYKTKVLRECLYNPWYYFREVVRIPDSGKASGVKFKLTRGNLALTFCQMMNMNIFLEQPRQTGKTISSLCWYLYLFNFGTANAEIDFLNKNLEASKLNLQRIKDIRDLLPTYLRMDQAFAPDGSKIKGRNNVESMQHPVNNNQIKTVASARNRVAAASLLRGRTTPLIYIDEYAFILYNTIIFTNMVPAFNTAANNSKRNGTPYGIVITTTPGMLTTEEGTDAWDMRNKATPFSEHWYDLSRQEIENIIASNSKSNFVHIRYTYQQLGYSEEWFKEVSLGMQLKWDDIRREILLEWATSSENSPFRAEDLDIVKGLLRQPINTVFLLGKYELKIYEKINLKYPPLVGVDVSGGYQQDSSAITVVDSYSTKVTAELNSNFISTPELAMVIYEIVSKWMPNAVVNIERNGGFGASVISRLLQTSVKRNLFYTIKDRVIEERVSGSAVHRKTQKTKVYGSDSTKAEREALIEILRDRVEYHKDKIISPTIYEELCGLEVKKNGKVEHSSKTHDDQVFSWLWALYIYYNGGDLMNDWGITKRVLRTDADLEEAIVDIHEDKSNTLKDIDIADNEEIQDQLNTLNNAPGNKSYEQWLQEEYKKDTECMERLLQNKAVRASISTPMKLPEETSVQVLPQEVFSKFNSDEVEEEYSVKVGNLSQFW